MSLILFDDHSWENLLPLTYTKPVSELRIGILTIREKWEKALSMSGSYMTQDYLSAKFPSVIADENLLINGALLPNEDLVKAIEALPNGKAIKKNGVLLAAKIRDKIPEIYSISADEYQASVDRVDFPWKIFSLNGQEIEADYQILTAERKSAQLSSTVNVIHAENVFVEEGFKGEYFTLNASSGPVYLGVDTEIMEGSVIRGPFALCEHSTIKLATKIYGPTSIGPHCKAGGEINNSVIQGHSNKGHDGFLGNSVIGEWCNIGADTNVSNLKNNYANVKIWNYPNNRFTDTGLQFCGLIMGDHSKCGINTMFNTGTVVGVSANIFGSGFPRNFVPSFSWGGAAGFGTYKTDKAFETMELVMERREIELTELDKQIYSHIFKETEKFRTRNN
jgi:UDP-N-acetylglucosamine diphosphorylase/glucosamine-1-phosphate N-acetyltransferase